MALLHPIQTSKKLTSILSKGEKDGESMSQTYNTSKTTFSVVQQLSANAKQIKQ